jgi:diguanylate cyclase (GGDEF)-like protein
MSEHPGIDARVVFVDDSRLMREVAEDALAGKVRFESAESVERALECLEREPADLVVSDLEMKGLSGLDLLERVRRAHPDTAFVLLTAHASVDSAVRALRMGATDYLCKPIQPDELVSLVERVLAHQRLLQENHRLREALQTVEACRELMQCVDPGEVHASSLELLLRLLRRRRGLAVFRRPSLPVADGIVFRGFGEEEANILRRAVLKEQDDGSVDPIAEVREYPTAPFDAALREAGLDGGPVLAVPMSGEETERGVAWVFGDGAPLGPGAIEQASLVSDAAGMALANAERYARAKERAFVDDVTEVYNARYLLQAAENEIQRAERYGKQLSVLLLDLDRFKLVNDRHGHLVGSNVLRRLSEVLKDCVRQIDTLARYGGDEFTILLVDTGHETGLHVAERIRRLVADTLFEGETGEPIRLTISIGVATYPDHARDRDGLLDLADKAMYRGKSQGRDCVCSASELS